MRAVTAVASHRIRITEEARCNRHGEHCKTQLSKPCLSAQNPCSGHLECYGDCSSIDQLKMMEGSCTFLRPDQSKSELLHDVRRGRITNLYGGNDSH
jgi:hypothetical protein